MSINPLWIILLISVLGPVIGSAIGVFRVPSKLFMYNMMSFAAGVMLAISFLELIPESIHLSSIWICSIGVLLGALVMFTLDKFVPHIHPGSISTDHDKKCHKSLKSTAIYLIVGIFLHNFPEGMAIATGSASNIGISLTIALAIAIHNIPEGICTSAPYFYCTKKRLKSFLISSSTAIPILVGFIFAYFLFRYIPIGVIGLITGMTAGLMIFISSDELIPCSCRKNLDSHSTIFSLIIGVLFVILLGAL